MTYFTNYKSGFLNTLDARVDDCSRAAVCERIRKFEKEGKFDFHVDPIDYSLVKPVDETFEYIPRGLKKIKYFFINKFIIDPFTASHTKKVFDLRVYGKEKLKGLKSAIVTLNHINMFDCLAAKRAFAGYKLKFTAADFNNRNDKMGEYMRAGGLMPFGPYSAMRNFNKAVEYYLSHKTFVLFYPEQAMWWNYDKPRPYKDGAFFYAAKHIVPVVPSFITFRTSGNFVEDQPMPYYDFNILDPIYPKTALNIKDNIVYLRDAAYDACKQLYENIYGKKLEFDCGENK